MQKQSIISKDAVLLITLASIILALISVMRIIAGVFLRNPAIYVEGIHSTIDVIISLIVTVTIYVVRSGFAERFPYGLYRLEDLIAILLSITFLFIVFVNINDLFKRPIGVSTGALIIQSITVPMLVLTVLIKYRTAAILNSPSMRADAIHMVVDVAESSSVVIGLTIYVITRNAVFYEISLLIAFIGLLVAAYEAAHDSILAILDLPKDKTFLAALERHIKKLIENKAELVYVKARWAGPIIFADILLRSHPLKSLESVSRLSRYVVQSLIAVFPEIKYVSIMIEPSVRRKLKIIIPTDSLGENPTISDHFARARYLMIIIIHDDKILGKTFIERGSSKHGPIGSRDNKNLLKEVLKGANLSEELSELGATDVIVKNIGEIAYSILLRHKIVVWKAKDPYVNNNIKMLIEGNLGILEEPTREANWKGYISRQSSNALPP